MAGQGVGGVRGRDTESSLASLALEKNTKSMAGSAEACAFVPSM